MTLKKTVSVLCLLASTALAGTPQFSYVGAVPGTAVNGGPSGVGFSGSTLYWGWAADQAGFAKISYISNFQPANAANYAPGAILPIIGPASSDVGQLASYNGALYAMIAPSTVAASFMSIPLMGPH